MRTQKRKQTMEAHTRSGSVGKSEEQEYVGLWHDRRSYIAHVHKIICNCIRLHPLKQNF